MSDSLTALTADITARLEVLERLLAAEADVLHAREPEALQQVAAEKLTLLGELDALGRRLLAALPAQDRALALGTAGEALLAALARCRHANDSNGGAIELTRACNEQLLAILRGQSPASALYGPGGRLARAGAGQSLATA